MSVPNEIETRKVVTDYLWVLRKHLWLITGIFLVTVITAAIWTFLEVPIYSASATVLIDPEPPKVLNIQEVAPMGTSGWDPNYYPTQYEIIKSKPVLTRTIETLNLKTRLPEVGSAREPHRVILASLAVEPKRSTRLIRSIDIADTATPRGSNAVAAEYYKTTGLEVKGSREAFVWDVEAASSKNKVQESSARSELPGSRGHGARSSGRSRPRRSWTSTRPISRRRRSA